MSSAQRSIQDYLTQPDDVEPTPQFIRVDWDALESAVRPLAPFQSLVDGLVIVEEQHEQTTRFLDETTIADVRAATKDAHDTSDYEVGVTFE